MNIGFMGENYIQSLEGVLPLGLTYFARKPIVNLNKTVYELVADMPLGECRASQLREAINHRSVRSMTEFLQNWIAWMTEGNEKQAIVKHERAHLLYSLYFNGQYSLKNWERIYLGQDNHLPKMEIKMMDLLKCIHGPRTGKANYELVNPNKRRNYVV